MDHAEAMARARTRTIPDGVYEAESYMDDDGIEIGKPVPIRVRVVVKGDEMTVDLTKVSKQVRGFYNSGITTGYACAQVAYKCLTSPTDYPINDGSFRSLKVIVPPGRIDQRRAPGADALVDDLSDDDRRHDLQGAGAGDPRSRDRRPPRRSAGRVAARHQYQDVGILHRQFRSARRRLGRQDAARTASAATVCINDGDTHNSPNEQAEVKFPIVVERYALVPDSGGAGRHRGGLGVERVVRARIPMTMNNQSRTRPLPALGPRRRPRRRPATQVALRIGGQWKTDFPNAKVLGGAAQAGRRFQDPLRRWRRLRQSVRARRSSRSRDDVRQGYVTVEAAAELYGVVLDPESFEVDMAATEKLRAARPAADGDAHGAKSA